jgi:hypothetical protein
VNIFQWKTAVQPWGTGDPTFVVMVYYHDGLRRIGLHHWPVGQGRWPGTANYEQANPVPVPSATWVQIEAYYKVGRTDGQITIWQDGIQIFDITGVNTQDTNLQQPNNGGLLWGVGNYSSSANSSPLLLYVDDMLVTNYRVSGSDPSTEQ